MTAPAEAWRSAWASALRTLTLSTPRWDTTPARGTAFAGLGVAEGLPDAGAGLGELTAGCRP